MAETDDDQDWAKAAASVAGMLKKAVEGYFRAEAKKSDGIEVVCILTGHGLKDPNNAIKHSAPPIVVSAEMGALMEHIQLR